MRRKIITSIHILFVICAFLLCYIGYILFVNFKTELQRERLLSELFTAEATHIKNQTDFLLTVYDKIMKDLSSDIRVAAYFISKRMGMSEAYGLWISKMEAVKSLEERYCQNIPGSICLDTMILIDNDQKILAYVGSSEVLESIPEEAFSKKENLPVPSYGMICSVRNVMVENQKEGYVIGCVKDGTILGEFKRYAGIRSKFVELASFEWANRTEKLVFYWENGSGWKLMWKDGEIDSLKPHRESKALNFDLHGGIGQLWVYSRPLPAGVQHMMAYILGIGALLCLTIIIHSLRQFIGQLSDLNLKLKQKAKEAEEASQAKSRYVSYISHEIRTPLNYILGYAQMLVEDPSIPEGKRHFLQSIVQGGELVIKIINDVLDIAKVEAGTLDLKPEPFSVKDCFQEIAQTAKLGAIQKGIRLQFMYNWEGDFKEDVWVIGDKLKCQQIMMNFLSNAIKVTPEGGTVKVETRVEETDDKKIKISVDIHDSGPGLSPEEQENLFIPFYQTKTGAKLGGTGLGLYFAHKLVELLGGKVSVESEIGKGTLIRFKHAIGKSHSARPPGRNSDK
ncbi:MAG: ATP-binding protein [Thermodesulforhabdaceae bacterium]